MSLLAQAIADAQRIVEDVTSGFGTLVTVTNPSGATAAISGLVSDVFESISPDTGVVVSGRQAQVTFSLSSLASLGVPSGTSSKNAKPWVLEFADAKGVSHVFKVVEARPDNTLGLIVCVLENYVPAP